jgi:UTP--glucose-1-phosphate uridylyltransferase
MTVRTALIPAAGLGTRFLPATKAQPKGLLPVVDTPAIQLVVEEALAAGLEDVIVVIGPGQDALRAHFAPDPELEADLAARGKTEALGLVRRATHPEVRFVVQEEALGLGDAVRVGASRSPGVAFAVLLADDLIDPRVPLLRDLLAAADRTGGSVVAAMHVGPREISMYGCIGPGERDGDLVRVASIVEKPDPAEAPSDLAVIGRYVLAPAILDALARTTPGAGGEIQLTDAIQAMMEEQGVYAYEFEGVRYDAGTTMGWLKASVELALQRPDLASEFRAYLAGLQL